MKKVKTTKKVNKTKRTWKKVDDKCIRHFWICTEDDCKNELGIVEPSWYQQNGTPVCASCDRDMEYSHTEILL